MFRNQILLLASAKFINKALDRFSKTKKPNSYYKNSYIECYYSCQQCKDYFKTAGAKTLERKLFIVLFF